ncbi:MAG: HAMP domain-containing histidine kinase [Epsilonproteobacteria bacterium]|nr:HAMP domain-containing histidine kinase [Campylobacterota bacterium]
MVKLENLNKQKKRFKLYLFLSYLLFATFLLSSIFMLHIYFNNLTALKKFEHQAKVHAKDKMEYLNFFYENVSDTLKAIANNKNFLNFVKDKQEKKIVDNIFLTIISSDKYYMQLRYIDANGNEVIRFDRKKIGAKPFEVPQNLLQNKSKRYYCKQCLNLRKNEIWFSNIDLNVEHGKVEEPFKPVIRIAYPIYINDTYKGFVILNIFMKEYLKILTLSPVFNVYLVDEKGYFIIHKNSLYNWSRYKQKQRTIYDEFPKYAKLILSTKKPLFIKDKKYYIQPLRFKNSQDLKLIYVEKIEKIKDAEHYIAKRTFLTVLLAILVAIPFALLFSKPVNTMYESLQEKSNELKDLANNLEERVAQEIEKNAKKDRLLENQSKLAALGEMLANIAHQWRHPLTRLSLILQNIKMYSKTGQLDQKLLNEYIQNSLEQIEYMSQTIEDFRNFYKDDKERVEFEIKNSIKNAVNIIEASIKHNGIKMELDIPENIKYKGYPNQLSQVILNLLHNSKEALEQNKIKNPFIKIRLYKKEDFIVIEIEDNGGGIDRSILHKIFDANFTTKSNTGTGIGLYMSKTIITDNFNGKLYAKNSKEGAIFTIELPI